jgi:serine protease Do
LIRDKKPISVSVVLGEKPEAPVAAAAPVPEPDPDVLDGVTVADLNDATRQEFRIPSEVKGAVVTAVEPDSVAASTGIRPGDVIQEIKRRPISSADEAVKLSEELKRDKQVLLRVFSRGSSRMLVLESKP